MAQPRITNTDKRILAELYEQTRKTVDDLPYTDEFEGIYTEFCERTGRDWTRHEVWRLLSNARKASRLTRKER